MDRPALVRGGDRVVLVVPNRPPSLPLPIGRSSTAPSSSGTPPSVQLPSELIAQLRGLREPPACSDPELCRALDAANLRWATPSLSESRRAREVAFTVAWPAMREACIAWTEVEVESRLASPEETVITMAREEERVERSITREEGAAQEFPGSGRTEVANYRRKAADLLERQRAHHADLAREVDRLAYSVAPNLSALVGPRVAARLLAHAGGLAGLARSPGSRIQLVGARKRPSRRGPRFGLLYRSVAEAGVPEARQGAFARSLAALAAIAARADSRGVADLTKLLLARRERRKEALRRSGR